MYQYENMLGKKSLLYSKDNFSSEDIGAVTDLPQGTTTPLSNSTNPDGLGIVRPMPHTECLFLLFTTLSAS